MHYDDNNYQTLLRDPRTEDGSPEVYARQTAYGSPEAEACGLYGVTDYVDALIDPKDFKERIAYCHETKQFPMYYHDESKVYEPGWYQDGYGFCFPAGTLVRMADGSNKPIETITVQDSVVSAECRVQNVAKVMRRWHTGNVGRLRLWGHSHLVATPEHPIKTQRGYVPLCDLVPGQDKVAIPRYTNESSLWCETADHVAVRTNIKRSERTVGIPGKQAVVLETSRIPDVIHLTPEFGRLIGFFLSEGSTSSGKVALDFAKHEWDTFCTEAVSHYKSCLGLTARIKLVGKNKTCARVTANSTEAAKLFESLCGTGAGAKRMHPSLCSGPAEFLRGVLTGWMDGDRGYGNHGVSISRHLALNMYDIANALGYRPIFSTHTKAHNRGGMWHRHSWDVGWSDNPRATIDADAMWQTVREVVWEPFEGYVYNIAVENDNSYIAEGIGVHNCWAYGLCAATMDAMAEQGDKPVRLAPFSLGSLVGWRNRGYYPDRAISYAKTNGIASAEFVPEYNLNPNTFKAGWEQDALKYRPDEWWDTDRTRGEASMVQQCVSILCSGRPLYVAYDWWGHALQCCGVEWDETKRNNIVWVLRNSHGEKGCIRLSGQRGVPDFAAGVRSIRVAA